MGEGIEGEGKDEETATVAVTGVEGMPAATEKTEEGTRFEPAAELERDSGRTAADGGISVVTTGEDEDGRVGRSHTGGAAAGGREGGSGRTAAGATGEEQTAETAAIESVPAVEAGS